MNVTVENLPHRQSVVTVEVDAERMAAARSETYGRLAQSVVVPGFRKGKAPRYLVERYLNQDLVQEDTETHLIDAIWRELRHDQFKDVALFDIPKVEVKQRNPLLYQMTLTLEPLVQLGDYKSVRIAPELVTVSDEDVDKALRDMREQQAQWQPVERRPVRQGDMVTIEAHGMIGPQPITLPQGYSTVVDERSAFLLPGFAMRMVDMEIGKEQEFAIQAPEDSTNKELAGASGTAYITVQEIKEKILPTLDDTLAISLGYANVADMRDKTRAALLKEREDKARNDLEEKILDAVAAISTVDFPAIMTDRQTETRIKEREESLQRQGVDMQLYLRILQMTMDQYRAEVRNVVQKQIRNYLLIEELGRAEGIVVEDSAVDAEIERLVAEQSDPVAARREMSTQTMHDQVKNHLYIKGLFDRLIAMVTEGQEPVAPQAALPSMTDSIVDAAETPAETKGEPEQPKLIIATH
jgi:trigger factor